MKPRYVGIHDFNANHIINSINTELRNHIFFHVKQCSFSKYSTPCSNMGVYKEDRITRVKTNAKNYLPKALNSITRGLPNSL